MSYRERERIKRKAQRWIANLEAMPEHERAEIVRQMRKKGLLSIARNDDTVKNGETVPPTVRNGEVPPPADDDETRSIVREWVNIDRSSDPPRLVLDLAVDPNSPYRRSLYRCFERKRRKPPDNLTAIIAELLAEETQKARMNYWR